MVNKTKLTDIARGATEINLRYTASLINLSKDYLRALSDALMNDLAEDETAVGDDISSGVRQKKTAPLIVAGRKGEIGNAAFSISNSSDKDGKVTVECRGNYGDTKVWADPKEISLKSGDEATLRVLTKFDESLPVGEERTGNVFIPELGLQVAEFVIRRLPDPPAKPKTKKRKKTNK